MIEKQIGSLKETNMVKTPIQQEINIIEIEGRRNNMKYTGWFEFHSLRRFLSIYIIDCEDY